MSDYSDDDWDSAYDEMEDDVDNLGEMDRDFITNFQAADVPADANPLPADLRLTAKDMLCLERFELASPSDKLVRGPECH